ncbi:hypothetical protein EIM01_06635 [Pseudomonas aeruginosa]|uniref:hypothetical protein n=1 Tax=Pseudomonas aeruginosa TaxID=287 RepID=UPI000F6231A9|nr:hypothetical protein [Pseudomonas aeruginosa]RRI84248.1 hypothetical protein EIM01_06635 [Pseudomonas aeruginosa]
MPSIINSKLKKESLSRTLARYSEAVDWLESKGLHIRASRYGRYAAHYERLIDNWGNESFSQISANRDYASSIYEVHGVVEIKDKLSELYCEELHQSLRRIISGKERYGDELVGSKPNSARDFLFELYMARCFKRAGYSIDFKTVADFNAHDEQDSIFVECKRPSKEDTFGKNVEKALKQVVGRFSSSDFRNQKGIAAIDMSSLINPDNEFTRIDGFSNISNQLKAGDERIALEIRKVFSRFGQDCVSVILYWRVPVLDTKEEAVGLYERSFSVPIYSLGAASEQVFRRVSEKLSRSVGL